MLIIQVSIGFTKASEEVCLLNTYCHVSDRLLQYSDGLATHLSTIEDFNHYLMTTSRDQIESLSDLATQGMVRI